MNKKVIVRIALFFLTINYLMVVLNLKSYFNILRGCFDIEIDSSVVLYMVISFIIAIISVLIFVVVKVLVKNEKDEIRGIKLKLEDGTFGTANWMNNEDIIKVLGVIEYGEYRAKSES